MTGSNAVTPLIERLHRSPLRVWSIVITTFGDAIVPRGGQIWLGDLIRLFERLRISPSTLRTAISRLAADGWVERKTYGRRSFYALSATRAAIFQAAERRIYAAGPPSWPDRRWLICQPAAPDALRSLGFGALPGGWMARPETSHSPDASAALHDSLVFDGRLRSPLDPAAVWPLADLATQYRSLIGAYEPIRNALDTLSPEDAMIARTLLVHDFRRIVLKDPDLPEALLPKDWPGGTMRALIRALYPRLQRTSATWLRNCLATPKTPLPDPNQLFYERFGGISF